MGLSLPMFLPVQSSLRRLTGVFVFAFAAFAASQVWAQAAVETYTNQAVPPVSAEEVLPEGMEWNKPLKAGDMVLPRLPKEKTTTQNRTQPPSLPKGEPQAPLIQKPAQPPLMSSSKTSSASVMLIQGMKNALQKAGQNPSIPEASATSEEATGTTGSGIGAAALMPPQLRKSSDASLAGKESSIDYEPGQAPRNLDGSPVKPGVATAASSAGSESLPSTEKSLAPSIDAGLANLEIPKATELQEPPVSLEHAATTSEASPSADTTSESIFGSIFGPPVKETAKEEKEAEPASAPTLSPPPAETVVEKPAAKACESKVESWTKDCVEAGYPASYTGKITGETRTECPSGNVKDVWLSNTCAEAVASSSGKTETPKALPAAARVDANCGSANGSPADSKPAAELCAAGTASVVSGEGPWRWSCQGSGGGMTVSCAAPAVKATTAAKASGQATDASAPKQAAVPEDGQCGSADGNGADSAPVDGLCAKGIASRVNGGGPWTWACSGTNGGQAAACTAPKKVDGLCGSASATGTDTRPERDLCSAGYASAVSGDGPWHWTCSGLYGGAPATCIATPKINAVCGTASLTGHREAPKGDLCKTGEASAVEGDGPWSWTCSGSQGGASVSCRAPTMVDGVCGASNGQSFTKAPDDDLCSQGHASRVTGVGPWNWNCSGLEGGETVSCTAVLGHKEADTSGKPVACGAATQTPLYAVPTQNLCAGGKPSAISGDGPWSWSCSDDEGHNVACTAVKATEGLCGTAANVPSVEAPAANLCASGGAGTVTSDKAKTHWTWDCRGSKGASTVSCSAPVLQKSEASGEDARCGTADGRGANEAPTSDLCAAGKAISVRGKGPWTWTCVAKSGRKVNCEAPRIIDGVCGSANGSIQKSTPLTGLCAAGAPTEVDGSGPWLWSCVGIGGGASVSCSAASQAQAKVDGACGAAANSVMTHMPEANLCDSGVPSAVNGEGPWTWTCSGLNGGIASTCTTSKVLPKAPPPPGPPVNANCGPANGVAAVHQPIEGLCSIGTPTDVSGDGPWNWNCLGSNGGMTVSCTAPMMPPAPIVGECGSANGVTTLVKPKSGLCSAGIASAVSGNGPWTWSCSGTNGGGAVSCVAPLAGIKGSSAKPLPSTVAPSSTYSSSSSGDEAPAPKAAPVGLVTPRLPTGPLPPLETGSLPQLQPSKPLEMPSEASTATQKDFSKSQSSAPPPVKASIVDAAGKPVPGSRLILDPEISTLNFERGADMIDSHAAKILDRLAGVMVSHADARITLTAYAGTNGDITPREARRLSLARALAIRDYLGNKGIASGRIDVRALGANVPSGDMDRVDIKVN